MKEQIKQIIDDYTTLYPEEYKDVIEIIKVKRDKNVDWAEVKDSDYVKRALVEYPETLYNMLKMRLEDEAFKWFQSKEGTLWFSKTHPEFNVSVKL